MHLNVTEHSTAMSAIAFDNSQYSTQLTPGIRNFTLNTFYPNLQAFPFWYFCVQFSISVNTTTLGCETTDRELYNYALSLLWWSVPFSIAAMRCNHPLQLVTFLSTQQVTAVSTPAAHHTVQVSTALCHRSATKSHTTRINLFWLIGSLFYDAFQQLEYIVSMTRR
jgi:hypothetical protein